MISVIQQSAYLRDPNSRMKSNKPLVYSCSGCSSAAQTANSIALGLDRTGELEMSCIAGVGGDVKPLVALAKSGRPVVALDGCALQCAKNCLKRHQVEPDLHFILSEFGVQKRYHEDFDLNQVLELTELILKEVSSLLKSQSAVDQRK